MTRKRKLFKTKKEAIEKGIGGFLQAVAYMRDGSSSMFKPTPENGWDQRTADEIKAKFVHWFDNCHKDKLEFIAKAPESTRHLTN